MRRIGLFLLVFSVLGFIGWSQAIGVPWFPGWQGPFWGVTDQRGRFEIVVLRTSDATHAITGKAYDKATGSPIANTRISVRYYGGLSRGTKVEVAPRGYQPQTAVVGRILSSYNPSRQPPTHKTYDVGTLYFTRTTGAQPPGPLVLSPMQDATIRGNPRWRGTNYGNGLDLLVTPEYSGYVMGDEARTLIQFDLSRIPAGAIVSRAILRLCVWEFHGDELLVKIHPITRDWAEGTVTWDTHNRAFDTQVLVAEGKLIGLQSGDWVEFDVTAAVNNLLSTGAPNHGWMIIPVQTTYAKFTSVRFWSKEGGVPSPGAYPGTAPATDRRPQLVINLGPIQAPVSIIDKTMCKNVQQVSPYDPIGRTTTFTTRDRRAWAWVKFGPVTQRHRVEFHWYWLDAPSGPSRIQVFRYDIPDPRTRGLSRWDWYVVWSSFRIHRTIYARIPQPSHWEVRIFVDGVFVDSLRFTIVS